LFFRGLELLSSKATICVVIINYHSQTLVNDCLNHLNSLQREDLEYLIVDNSEHPDTDKIKSKHRDVLIYRSNRNLGFAGGCNIGLRHAIQNRNRYVLLLNPDTRFEQDFIAPLLATLETIPHAGMAGPLIFEDTALRRPWQGIGRLNWWLGGPIQRWKKSRYDYIEPMDVPFLSGCALLLRLEAVKSAGLMDERYFLYFEDIDYSRRLICCGWRVILVPKAQILHAHSSTIGRHSRVQVYFLSRNRIWLTRRWAHLHQFVVFMLVNTLVKIPVMAMSFGFVWRRPKLISAYLKGFVEGWKGHQGIGEGTIDTLQK
jgi:GT2 family glycosyltransferase